MSTYTFEYTSFKVHFHLRYQEEEVNGKQSVQLEMFFVLVIELMNHGFLRFYLRGIKFYISW